MPDPTHRRIPTTAVLTVGVLLTLPLMALLLVPLYARKAPELWGFPFFYWYQFLWVFLSAGSTYVAFIIVVRARRTGDDR
jgi:hypothetical protein